MSDEVNFRTPTYRVRRGRGLDPATRRLALIAAGLGSALLAVVGAWSITGHHHGAVPVIAPPSGPMRVKPENPGGMQLTASQELFAATHADDTDQGKLAPPPEIPDPQALRPPPKPAAPAAAVTAAADAGELHSTAKPAALTARSVAAVAASQPAQSPASAARSPAAAASVTPPGPTPALGHAMVQLAALPTEQAAQDEWTLLQHRLPDLLRGRQPTVSKADVNGRSWWRVRTGGFADPAEAKGFCEKVRAKGASCDVLRS